MFVVNRKFRIWNKNWRLLPEPLKLTPWESAAENAVKVALKLLESTRYICKNAIYEK